MYISIYFLKQDLVPFFLFHIGLLWSAQNHSRYLSTLRVMVIRARASELVTSRQIFYVLYFYVCDSRHKRRVLRKYTPKDSE